VIISMTGAGPYSFSPSAKTVKVGTTVVWKNNSGGTHNVVSTSSGPLNSGWMRPMDTFSYTFTLAGTYHYYCEAHPAMTGTITVTN
jgi:plastocyanin